MNTPSDTNSGSSFDLEPDPYREINNYLALACNIFDVLLPNYVIVFKLIMSIGILIDKDVIKIKIVGSSVLAIVFLT